MDYDIDDGSGRPQKFKVYVRLRPVPPELGLNQNGVCTVEHRIIRVQEAARTTISEFVFDRIWGADATQEDVFNDMVQPLVDHALKGYNACCFAYGQTGSGKTYTMFGKEGADVPPTLRGMIPRAVEYLFRGVSEARASSDVKITMFVSFMEIYVEQVRDLGKAAVLAGEGGGRIGKRELEEWSRSNLDVMEDAAGHTSVKDLTYIEATSVGQVLKVLRDGAAFRTTAATAVNDVSSRSHTVFTITVVQQREGTKPISGRLHLVDLAGSERQSKTHSEGQRLTEAKAINKSLTALGKVVLALTQDSGERAHIPFRDTKLTRILKDSLQGNCMTSMLAALHPLPDNAEECFNTLQFAVRCQNIDLAPHVNVLEGPGEGGATGGNAAGGGGGGGYGEDDAANTALMAQVEELQQELEFTHAHYQKLLESVAGPEWTQNMGPLERTASMVPRDWTAGSFDGGVAGSGGAMSARGGPGESGNISARGIGAMGSRPSIIGPGSMLSGNAVAAEQRARRLEGQLEATRAAHREVEDALARKKREFDEMRDRLLSSGHTQHAEIRKLRATVAELNSKLAEAQTEVKHKVDEAAKRYEADVARAARDADTLRSQLAELSNSVSPIIEERSRKTSGAAKAAAAASAEANRRIAAAMVEAARETEAQVTAVRQQNEAFLAAKDSQLEAARAELVALRKATAEEIAALQAECDYLATYAERVAHIVCQMQAGVYGVVERGGLRAFRLPPRERPPTIDSTRLRYLSTAGEAAARLLEAARAAASRRTSPLLTSASAPPTAPHGLGGTHPSLDTSAPPTLRSARSSMASVGSGLAGAASPDLGPELEALRAQWKAEVKNAMTKEVLSELQGHRTVEYVRSLEASVARYRAELQTERRASSRLMVSLRSAQRSMVRPDSPLALAITGSPLMEPPKWGEGHVRLPGAMLSEGRPATAAAVLQGSTRSDTPNSLSQSRYSRRPYKPTSTSMQLLASSFTDYGVPC